MLFSNRLRTQLSRKHPICILELGNVSICFPNNHNGQNKAKVLSHNSSELALFGDLITWFSPVARKQLTISLELALVMTKKSPLNALIFYIFTISKSVHHAIPPIQLYKHTARCFGSNVAWKSTELECIGYASVVHCTSKCGFLSQ